MPSILELGSDCGLPSLNLSTESLLEFHKTHRVGQFPVHEATLSCDERRLKKLVNANIDLNWPLPSGDSPLHLAAHAGVPNIMQILIDGGADVNATEQERYTPLHFAVCSWLRDYCPEVKVENRLECCRQLLAAGAAIDARGGNGRTPLHLATQQAGYKLEDLPVVRYLLEQGANINLADREGWYPLHFLWCCEEPEVYRLLISFGADPTKENKRGESIADFLDDKEVFDEDKDLSEIRNLLSTTPLIKGDVIK